MAGLKELRTRISSIKSTQKITSAMKMVAAARLRHAQADLEKSQAYNDDLQVILGRLYKDMKAEEKEKNIRFIYPRIVKPAVNPQNYLLVVFSSDRGLCGSYNAYVVKESIRHIKELRKQNKNLKVLCIGKKAGDSIKNRIPEQEVDILTGVCAKRTDFKEIQKIIEGILKAYTDKVYDVCEVVYTDFVSAINREVKIKQLVPYLIDENDEKYNDKVDGAFFDYDGPKPKVLIDVLLLFLTSAFFQYFVESQASEHGARMTSMDNATRNASDMISKLTLKYNRLRQTAITTELIEIISGAEAL